MGQPKYLHVVDRLSEEIRRGLWLPGARIEAQRALAARFGVTISTVTRAIAEAEQRGLLVARPGSGTFVRKDGIGAALAAGSVDLRLNSVPTPPPVQAALEAALREVARSADATALFGPQPVQGLAADRTAAAAWLRLRGIEDDGAGVLLSHGAQHGLAACLTALAPPGSTMLAEEFVYPGFRQLAAAFGVRLVGVALDAEGMRPDALAAALAATGARLVLCSPTAQNPTTATMSTERRQAILAACRQHDAVLVEDDVFGHLAGDTRPPLAALAPDRVIYVTGLSKSLAPGLRLGILRPPRALLAHLMQALASQHWVAPGLMAALFTRLVADGAATAALHHHRRDMRARHALAREVLGAELGPPSYHLWIPVPPPWRLDDFVRCLEERGVHVLPSRHFAVTEGIFQPRVRAALGSNDMVALRAGLTVVAGLLKEVPGAGGPLI